MKDLEEVNIGQPAAMKEVADVINTVSLDDQKLYLQWGLIDAAASYLSDDFEAQNFDFYSRTMSGKKEMQPRWKRSVSTVDGVLGEVVGQMYVEVLPGCCQRTYGYTGEEPANFFRRTYQRFGMDE